MASATILLLQPAGWPEEQSGHESHHATRQPSCEQLHPVVCHSRGEALELPEAALSRVGHFVSLWDGSFCSHLIATQGAQSGPVDTNGIRGSINIFSLY